MLALDTLIGQTLSHYKILAKIVESSTGTVYKAVDTRSNGIVTLKPLRGAGASPEIRAWLEKARALHHPNIARIYEFVGSDDIEFAVVEATEGESVDDFLSWRRPDRHELLRFVQQIASALEAAHSVGIVHGPLDPTAIFITAASHIKIYDIGFGILEPPPPSERERVILFGKSAPYVSPEQLEGARPDVRSDIFSFGALLYRMATGKPAFPGDTLSETWKAIRKRKLKPATKIDGRAAPRMDKLLDRCLRKKPESRFQQFGEIQPLLEESLLDKEEAPQPLKPELDSAVIGGSLGRVRIAGIALAAVAAVAAVSFWLRPKPAGEPVLGKHLLQLTKDPGYDSSPAFSADGTQLAYASDRDDSEGRLNLWLQPAEGGEPRRLTSGSNDDYEPAFAPDGKTIAFRSERNGGGIYLISARGGDARLLAAEGRRPRYSPDGRWIAYWTGPPNFGPKPEAAYKMFIVPSSGGAPRQIRPDMVPASYPTWSPDGKSLLFVGRDDAAGAGVTEWFVTPVEGRDLHNTGICRTFHIARMLPDSQCGTPGDWKGNHVYFSLLTTGAVNLWRADLDPGSPTVAAKPVRVTSGEANETEPFASGNGAVAFTRLSYNVDIWDIPLDADQGRVTGRPERWIGGGGYNLSPSMTEDGSLLSFQSNRTGRRFSWVLDTKNGKQTTAANNQREELGPLISPDGANLAYSEERIGGKEEYYRPVGGGSSSLICHDCAMGVSGWSRDGKSVLIDYLAGAPRHLAIALIELSSARKTVLLREPNSDLIQASFSPDQRSIIFTALQDGGTARVFTAPFHGDAPSTPKEWVALTDGAAWDTSPRWSPDGNLVYYASTRDGHNCVWARRLDSAGQPSGQPFAVAHFHALRRQPPLLPAGALDLFIARDQMLISLGDQTGNLWSAKIPD